MSTITAIMEPDPDGTLHLPVPEAWRRHLAIKVKAELELAAPQHAAEGVTPQAGCLKGFWMAPDFDEPLEDFKAA